MENASGDHAYQEFRPLEVQLRRSGVFIAKGWQYCQAALDADAEFSESVRTLWMQFVTRSVVGWGLLLLCGLAKSESQTPWWIVTETAVLTIPIVMIVVVRRHLPQPWFGNLKLTDHALSWLHAMLCDESEGKMFPILDKWRRRELQSGRCCRQARLTALHRYFQVNLHSARQRLRSFSDWMPLCELLAIGVPVLWSLSTISLQKFVGY